MLYYICKYAVWTAFHLCYSLRYEGKENIPDKEAVIYTSNHRSNADPPLVGAGAKGKFAFMAKEELFKNPLFAALIRALGAFPVSRGKGDMTVIDTAVERLKSGRSLVIFPEGTRSKDGKVHRGKTGAALIAARSGCRIIPVGVVFGEKLKFRCRITVKYGKPIDPSDYCPTCVDEPDPRKLVRLKNAYMAEITRLVEGDEAVKPEKTAEGNADE